MLDQDFSHYQKHGDMQRKQGNNFFQDLNAIDYRDFEHLQNSHTLYLILTPPMDLAGLTSNSNNNTDSKGFAGAVSSAANAVNSFLTGGSDCGGYADAEDQSNLNINLNYYADNLISGHLMKCSSLLEGLSGLKTKDMKVEKVIESTIGKGLSVGRASSRSDETEMTLSFNETKDLDVYNTFITIMEYQKAVVDGHRDPIEDYVLNGIIDYVFQLYAINFDGTGLRVLSTVKMSNITLVEVNSEIMESSLNSIEHKKTIVQIRVSDFTYNDYGIFQELDDYGILPSSKYIFNERTKSLEYAQSANSASNITEAQGSDNNSTSDFLMDVGKTMFPNTGGSLEKIFNNDGCSSNVNKMSSIQSIASGLF